jgi:hypothetical protein
MERENDVNMEERSGEGTCSQEMCKFTENYQELKEEPGKDPALKLSEGA